MKKFTSSTQKIGKIGEDVAVRFLVKRGFRILEQNYTKAAGEIDIVAVSHGTIHFFEVKTVKSGNLSALSCGTKKNVSRETYNPFENMHPGKLKRFARTVNIYLIEKNVPQETKWQIDGLAVFLDIDGRKARVEIMENII